MSGNQTQTTQQNANSQGISAANLSTSSTSGVAIATNPARTTQGGGSNSDLNVAGIQIVRSIRNLHAGNINADSVSHIMQSIMGGLNGSSAKIGLEIGLSGVIGGSFANVEAGLKIKLDAEAAVKHDGKFTVKGGAGIIGFASAQLGWLKGEAERAAEISLEGEWDSVLHFGAYLYQQIHERARTVRNLITSHGISIGRDTALGMLADAPDSALGQRSPLLTQTTSSRSMYGGSIGTDDNNIAYNRTTIDESFTKSRGGQVEERGTTHKDIYKVGIAYNGYSGSGEYESSRTTVGQQTTREEKFTIEFGGPSFSTSGETLRELAEIPTGMGALENGAEAVLNLSRRVISRIGNVSSADREYSFSRGESMVVELVLNNNNGRRSLKELSVLKKRSLSQRVQLTVPTGSVVNARGSAAFEGEILRPIFHMAL